MPWRNALTIGFGLNRTDGSKPTRLSRSKLYISRDIWKLLWLLVTMGTFFPRRHSYPLIRDCRTWQDWGLRCARKTAFHAAVQYYCHELGITAHETPIPVEWADTETLRYNPDGDEPQSPGVVSMHSNEGPATDPNLVRKPSTANVLGFRTPGGLKGSTELTRVRKSKSRKKALRSLGAGG